MDIICTYDNQLFEALQIHVKMELFLASPRKKQFPLILPQNIGERHVFYDQVKRRMFEQTGLRYLGEDE
jgi:hypothetical protein